MPLTELQYAVLLAALAGATIPLGGLAARIEKIRPAWLEDEFRHGVIAFGGGALLAAVALVLVPEGSSRLSVWMAPVAFGAGGVCFFLVDRLIERRGKGAAQLLAMLLDFLPKSMALGAVFAAGDATGPLLGRLRPAVVISAFCALVLLGPLAAWFGFTYLRPAPEILGAIMLFAAGGILYLTFEDIAPQAYLKRHWAPPLGAVAGFMLGMAGDAMIG
jgi:ZIP family zinc transporter